MKNEEYALKPGEGEWTTVLDLSCIWILLENWNMISSE